MRKALIAVIVASALFAVGAFAATFTVSSEDVASGAGAVDRCASSVEITFGTLTPPADPASDWTVASATATFHNGDPTSPVAFCDGFSADLALVVDGASFTTISAVTVGAGGSFASGTAGFTFAAQDVGAITSASVAVDGVVLDDTTFTEV